MSVRVCLFGHVCVRQCVRAFVLACLSVRECMCVRVCALACMCVRLCVCVRMYVYLIMCVRT